MLNLIQNENMKIYRRPRTWLLVAIMLIILVVHAFATYSMVSKNETVNPNWKQELIEKNKDIQNDMKKNAALPKPILDQMEISIKKNEYYIENDIAPGKMTQWSYLGAATEVMLLVTIFAAVIAGDIVASEFSGGTIKLLLIRPMSRTKILMSKYFSTLLFGGFLTVILAIASYVIGGALFGFGGADQPYIYVSPDDNTVHTMTQLKNVGISLGLQLIGLLMIVTMSFMISAALRSSTMAISFSLVAMFIGSNLVSFLAKFSWVKYILFANMDLRRYIEGPILVEGMTMNFSIAMLAVYFLAFHFFAWLLFTKRDVAA